ncbi:MAG: hypothetical protein ABI432_07220 [Flavobacteriales bacterium]
MNTVKTMNIAVLVTALSGGLMLASCSETPKEQSEEMNKKMEGVQEEMQDVATADTRAEWQNEREDVLTKLRNMRDDIDKELNRCNEKLAGKDLKASERAEQTAMQAELMREKTTVVDLLAKVEGSDQTTWSTVKEDTRKTSDDVEAWWKRFKDNIDKKTDADRDNDGH